VQRGRSSWAALAGIGRGGAFRSRQAHGLDEPVIDDV
jgi:hypothetical protein